MWQFHAPYLSTTCFEHINWISPSPSLDTWEPVGQRGAHVGNGSTVQCTHHNHPCNNYLIINQLLCYSSSTWHLKVFPKSMPLHFQYDTHGASGQRKCCPISQNQPVRGWALTITLYYLYHPMWFCPLSYHPVHASQMAGNCISQLMWFGCLQASEGDSEMRSLKQ